MLPTRNQSAMPRVASLTLLAALAQILVGCSTPADTFASYGGMRDVMRLGKTEPRVALQQFAEPGWYGLGALAGLAGEILIDDGKVWVTRKADEVQPATAADHATLLAVARVSAWRDLPLTADCDLDALVRQIAAAVPAAATAEAAPLPFLIEGEASQLAMHVVRGYCPHGEPVEGAAPPAVWQHTVGRHRPVRLVGIFAPGRAGTLTHHGTALHLHAMVHGKAGPVAMGHVDAVTLAAGSVLRVPANR